MTTASTSKSRPGLDLTTHYLISARSHHLSSKTIGDASHAIQSQPHHQKYLPDRSQGTNIDIMINNYIAEEAQDLVHHDFLHQDHLLQLLPIELASTLQHHIPRDYLAYDFSAIIANICFVLLQTTTSRCTTSSSNGRSTCRSTSTTLR